MITLDGDQTYKCYGLRKKEGLGNFYFPSLHEVSSDLVVAEGP